MLGDYIVPYPSRDDPDIQTKMWAKKEIRECVPDPDIEKGEYRVDPTGTFYNEQVLAARVILIFGSAFIIWKPGTGKTGIIACFEKLEREYYPERTSKFIYVSGADQINEFKSQIADTFGSKEESELYGIGVKKENVRRKRILKQHFMTMTYSGMAKEIRKRNNAQLIKDFGNAAIFLDEIQMMKLDEKEDLTKIRERLLDYIEFFRLIMVCPNATIVLLTASPDTNHIADLVYHTNLLPKTKKIKTPLSKKIYKMVKTKHPTTPKPEWIELDYDVFNEIVPDEEYDERIFKRLRKAEIQLESILRGRVLYIREAETGVFKRYPEDSYVDEYSRRPVISLSMSKFQSEAYAEQMMRYMDNQERYEEEFDNVDDMDVEEIKSMKRKKDAVYLSPKQASVFVFPTERDLKRKLKNPDAPFKDEGIVGKEGIALYVKKKKVSVIKTAVDYTTNVNKKGEVKETYYYKNVVSKRGKKEVKSKQQEVFEVTKDFASYLSQDKLLKESSVKLYYLMTEILEKTPDGVVFISEEFYEVDCLVIAATLESRPIKTRLGPWKKGSRWSEFNIKKENDWLDKKTGKIILNKAPRYFIYTSKTDKNIREQGLALERHPDNVNGEYLRVVVATEVGSVGINIFHVSDYVNMLAKFTHGADEQTEGRTIRRKSHEEKKKRIKKGEKIYVTIHNLVAVMDEQESESSGVEIDSIDALLFTLIFRKAYRSAFPRRILKAIALDAPVNRRRNIRSTDLPFSADCDYMPCDYLPYNCDMDVEVDYSTYYLYHTHLKELEIKDRISEAFKEFRSWTLENLQKNYLFGEFGYSEVETVKVIRNLIERSIPLFLDDFGITQYLQEYQGVLYTVRDPKPFKDNSLQYYSKTLTLQLPSTLEDQILETLNINDEIQQLMSPKLKTFNSYADWLADLSIHVKMKLFEESWKFTMQEAEDAVWPLKVRKAFENLFYFDDKRGVLVHEIGLTFDETTNFNAVESLLKPKGPLRILKNGIWRYTNPQEREYYAKKIENQMQKKLYKYYKKFEAEGVMGIIVRTDTVHIRNFELVEDEEGPYYSSDEGTKCTGMSVQNLLPILYDVKYANKDYPDFEDDPETNSEIVKKAFPALSRNYMLDLENNAPQKLSFMANNVDKKVRDLCSELISELYEKNAIFVLQGSASKTVKRLT